MIDSIITRGAISRQPKITLTPDNLVRSPPSIIDEKLLTGVIAVTFKEGGEGNVDDVLIHPDVFYKRSCIKSASGTALTVDVVAWRWLPSYIRNRLCILLMPRIYHYRHTPCRHSFLGFSMEASSEYCDRSQLWCPQETKEFSGEFSSLFNQG